MAVRVAHALRGTYMSRPRLGPSRASAVGEPNAWRDITPILRVRRSFLVVRHGKSDRRPSCRRRLRPDAVALAKRLHRASPKTGKRISLRKIAAALAEAGHLNERRQPVNPKSIIAMVTQKT